MRLKVTDLLVLLLALLPAAAWSAQDTKAGISGTYELVELGPTRAALFSTPLIDLTRIKPSSGFKLQISSDDMLRMTYVDLDGTAMERQTAIRASGCARTGQTIVCEAVVPNVGARILPGISTQLKRITYRLDEQGDLQLVRNHIEKGWVLFAIPFHEDHEVSLTLKAIR